MFFNKNSGFIMHLDLNSCFATVEQQANPLLRGKPIAVAAYNSPGGCIVAPSIEAKKLGIKVGMRVKDGKNIYPDLIILTPDPNKYRFINQKLLALFQRYSSEVSVRSIDEMVIDFQNSPQKHKSLFEIAQILKKAIKKEIGEWLTVSVGISTNHYLAKLAAGLKKPDGLVQLSKDNVENVLKLIKLTDFHGIKKGNCCRLNLAGIYTPLEFYSAPVSLLRKAFGGINGYYWYLRLHGLEIDNVEFSRKSYGNSYALYKATSDNKELSQILCKLVEKMGGRLRKGGFTAEGIHLSCLFSDYNFWHHGQKTIKTLYSNSDLYKEAYKLLLLKPQNTQVRIMAVSCFNLAKNTCRQTSFWEDDEKKYRLTKAIDAINEKWGNFVVSSGRMIGMENKILDRIAFGGIKELEETLFEDSVQKEGFCAN